MLARICTQGVTLQANSADGPVPATAIDEIIYPGLFWGRPVMEVDNQAPGATTKVRFDMRLRTVLTSGTIINISMPDFAVRDCARPDCAAPIEYEIEGLSRDKFINTPSIAVCTPLNAINVSAACSWTADHANLTIASECYRLRCPSSCTPAVAHSMQTCSTLEQTDSTPLCAAAAVYVPGFVVSSGGDVILRLVGNVTNESCPRPDPSQFTPPFSSGSKWVSFYSPPLTRTRAIWFPETGDLRLTVVEGESIPADAQISIIFNNITIPKEGLPALKAVVVSVNANRSTCNMDSRNAATAPIGSVGNTSSLEFRDAVTAGLPTTLAFSFTPRMSIAAYENILIRLPEFKGSDSPSIQGLGGPSNASLLASWDQEFSLLNVTVKCGMALPEMQPVIFSVPYTAGISIPSAGIQVNQQDLTIEIVAAAGYMPEQPIFRTSATGSFRSSTSILYANPVANSVSAITIVFRPEMDLTLGCTVTIVMPLFVRDVGDGAVTVQSTFEFSPLLVSPPSLPINAFSGRWSASTQRLVLSLPQHVVPAGTRCTLVVPSTDGIRLPPKGIDPNQESITISTNTQAGGVENAAMAYTPAVGSFGFGTAISFFPRTANQVVEMRIKFATNMITPAGVVFFIKLPDFYGPSQPNITVLSNPKGKIQMASWAEPTATLSLTVANSSCVETVFFEDESFSVTVGSHAGIRTPLLGVRVNQRTITISAPNNTLGPVLPTSFVSVQSIGSLVAFPGSPILSCTKTQPARISMSLLPVMNLSPNDNITVTLPGFFTTVGWEVMGVRTVTRPPGIIELGIWEKKTSTIVFTVSAPHPALTNLEIIIPEDQTINTPLQGK
jgi:hypothetical protein